MEFDILEFDKRKISEEEIKAHIKFYSQKAEEGMKLFGEGKKRESMEILKEIRRYLKEEYMYYKKANTQKYIIKNSKYITYYNGIFEAYVKQIKPTSYDSLYSNLYDVNDYISNYEMAIFK